MDYWTGLEVQTVREPLSRACDMWYSMWLCDMTIYISQWRVKFLLKNIFTLKISQKRGLWASGGVLGGTGDLWGIFAQALTVKVSKLPPGWLQSSCFKCWYLRLSAWTKANHWNYHSLLLWYCILLSVGVVAAVISSNCSITRSFSLFKSCCSVPQQWVGFVKKIINWVEYPLNFLNLLETASNYINILQPNI